MCAEKVGNHSCSRHCKVDDHNLCLRDYFDGFLFSLTTIKSTELKRKQAQTAHKKSPSQNTKMTIGLQRRAECLDHPVPPPLMNEEAKTYLQEGKAF